MQESWHSPAGRTAKSRPSVAENWLLVPFFLLLLICSQLSDIGKFILARGANFFDKCNLRLAYMIDSLPCSLQAKYTIMVMIAWLPTVMLIGVLVWASIDLWHEYQQSQDRLTYSQEDLEPYIVDSHIINEDWPAELQASSSALVQMNEQDLIDLTAQFSNLSDKDKNELSQNELINLGLVYYYFGNQTQYQRYLQQARIMDPNERVFKR